MFPPLPTACTCPISTFPLTFSLTNPSLQRSQPSIGIPRTKRWKRAAALNLNPPIEVLAVLLKQDAKKSGSMQRSQVDELMSSKFVVNEGGLLGV
jgi:hypothetical protein